jgi:hypothetical protein
VASPAGKGTAVLVAYLRFAAPHPATRGDLPIRRPPAAAWEGVQPNRELAPREAAHRRVSTGPAPHGFHPSIVIQGRPCPSNAAIMGLAWRPEHVAELYRLPPIHHEPFDRAMIAQAIAEDLSLQRKPGALVTACPEGLAGLIQCIAFSDQQVCNTIMRSRIRWLLRSVGMAAIVALVGCVPMAGPTYAPAGPNTVPPPPTASFQKVMIFGGDGHRTYLGCLNCSEYATDSVHNEYGTHGSPYASESIHNHYSQYGSPYSTESACNEYAFDPPVIVDASGRYYGRLTLNRYHAQLGAGASYMGWLAAVCHD